jgi:formate-dependent nitrite reductase membrane component NrfD
LHPSGSLVAFVETTLDYRPNKRACTMYKLIVIVAAAMPTIFLLRALFVGRSPKPSQAFSEFKKQIDYLVWAILFVIGCVFVYSVASLIHSMWR